MSRRGIFGARPSTPTLPQRPSVEGVGSPPVDEDESEPSDSEETRWSRHRDRERDSDSETETDEDSEDDGCGDDNDSELLLERSASIRFLMEGILLPTISTFGFLGERNGIKFETFFHWIFFTI